MLPTFAFAFLLLSSGIIYLEYGGVSADRRGPVAPPRLAVSGGLSDTEVGATGNPSTAPLKWSGLLVIHDVEQDGKSNNMICTAQFIAPRVVLTAAHCVQDYKTGAWYDLDEMYFLLQYQNGQYSQVYRPVCLSRFDGWFPLPTGAQSPTEFGWADADRFQWDYAMILVDHDSTTGYFNWDVDWSGKYQNATMTGYPLAVLNGQIIQIVDGTLHFAPDRHNVVELVHAERTDITQGASGGAWVANFSKEETADHNSVLSVSSYLVPRLPGISFGPYLTADYRKLLDHVSRGCPH
jgi:Trypsin